MKSLFVIILIKTALLVSPCLSDEVASFLDFTERWEGRRNEVYICTSGHKTIGVGHKLLPHEDFTYLSDVDIDAIYLKDMKTALNDVKSLVANFDEQPLIVQQILVDLSYNLGRTKLSKFKKTLDSCEVMDYITMSKELKDSKWYHQTGNRAKHHVKALGAL